MRHKLLLLILVSLIAACSSPEEKAKKAGFASVEQMQAMNQKGFKTMDDYLATLLPGSGCNSVSELKHAMDEGADDCNQLIAIRKKQEAESALASKYKEGMTYTYYKDNSCKPNDTTTCLSANDYKELCDSAIGATKGAFETYSYNAWDDRDKTILLGGSVDKIRVRWAPSNDGRDKCFVIINASGIYKGSSTRIEAQGVASSFIKNSSGEILVSYFSIF